MLKPEAPGRKGILKKPEPLEDSKRSSMSGEGDAPKYGVYKTELVLLSKSNQSRFSRFILDYGIQRKDDRLRQEALKFIECLRHLPEYEPLVEEGTEEAIMNGDEEVKFIKKDLLVAKRQLVGPAARIVDLIAYTITGNIKQFQKLFPEASPLEQDAHALHLLILNTRGIGVKAYDQARDNTLIPTREWNPVHCTLYF
jgi:hypothetical protein